MVQMASMNHLVGFLACRCIVAHCLLLMDAYNVCVMMLDALADRFINRMFLMMDVGIMFVLMLNNEAHH